MDEEAAQENECLICRVAGGVKIVPQIDFKLCRSCMALLFLN